MEKPSGYSKKEIENSLKDIKEDDIPADKKINIIAIMMEAYGEYYGAAEPPVRCGESHLSGLTEPLRSL